MFEKQVEKAVKKLYPKKAKSMIKAIRARGLMNLHWRTANRLFNAVFDGTLEEKS